MSDKHDEIEFIADRLVDKVWQGNEDKRGLARQIASVSIAALNDYTATRYMETADHFTGPELRRAWLAGQAVREARASVALDGETVSVGPVRVWPDPGTPGDGPEDTEEVPYREAVVQGEQFEALGRAFDDWHSREDAVYDEPGEVIPASPELVALGDELARQVPPTSTLLASVDNALRNGSYMTNANLAFEYLCMRLGIDREALEFDPKWSQKTAPPELGDLESLRRVEPSEDANA